MEEAAGPACPKCRSAGALVWAHIVHCSDWSNEDKVRATTAHYALDEEDTLKTAEQLERKGEVIDLPAR